MAAEASMTSVRATWVGSYTYQNTKNQLLHEVRIRVAECLEANAYINRSLPENKPQTLKLSVRKGEPGDEWIVFSTNVTKLEIDFFFVNLASGLRTVTKRHHCTVSIPEPELGQVYALNCKKNELDDCVVEIAAHEESPLADGFDHLNLDAELRDEEQEELAGLMGIAEGDEFDIPLAIAGLPGDSEEKAPPPKRDIRSTPLVQREPQEEEFSLDMAFTKVRGAAHRAKARVEQEVDAQKRAIEERATGMGKTPAQMLKDEAVDLVDSAVDAAKGVVNEFVASEEAQAAKAQVEKALADAKTKAETKARTLWNNWFS